MPRVIFDVGANDGSSCAAFAEEPGTIVYAFEPQPMPALQKLQAKNPAYRVIPAAVSDSCKQAEFHITGLMGGGCSSLNPLSGTIDLGKHTTVTETINVPVITLASFLDQHPEIKSIDYLHIDTQGEDLRVLQGLGDYISIVRSGKVEAAIDGSVCLYKNQATIGQLMSFLTLNGFEIVDMRTETVNFEVNIRFIRNTVV